MKKLSIIMFLWVLCVEVHGQGIYQLWGLTPSGGDDLTGSIYSTNSAGENFYLRYQFENIKVGQWPDNQELVELNGKLYGMASVGGIIRPNKNYGIIFEFDPIANIYTKKVTLDNSYGNYSSNSLAVYNGKLYGATMGGGDHGFGVIFEFDPSTDLVIKKHHFSGADGSGASGCFAWLNGKFYGVAKSGGVNDNGVIFEWDPVTNIYTKRFDFVAATGSAPVGKLGWFNNKFYGMTFNGGTNGLGVIYEWDPVTGIYSKKIDFTATIGSNPLGSLTLHSSKFYGVTFTGGLNDQGVIFEFDPSANMYQSKHHFNSTDGKGPIGNMTFYNGRFYGTVPRGGPDTFPPGYLYEWNPVSNVYTSHIQFSGVTGSNPRGSLTVFNGKLYGTTNEGGVGLVGGGGVIFEWDPVSEHLTRRLILICLVAKSPMETLFYFRESIMA